MRRWIKRSLWLVVAGLAAVGIARAFRTPAVLVDVATITRGNLIVTVDDDGRTRVRERYTITAPTAGKLLRTPLKAGAIVRARETVLAEFEPLTPPLLDARSRAEANARVAGAAAAVEEAKARQAQAKADLDYAAADLQRRGALRDVGLEAGQEFDRAARDERRAVEALGAATFAVRIAEHELGLAQASLLDVPAGNGAAGNGATGATAGDGTAGEPTAAVTPTRRIELRSPIDGLVLRVHEESARTVTAGTAILEVGNTEALEVVAEFLSQDAVNVRPGMAVLVEGWGADRLADTDTVLHGEVRLVEPGGFTKISALGVEEQRVNILVDPNGPAAGWALLRDGYRVLVRIVIWQQSDVLLVPTGALFRDGKQWVVLTVEGGHARRREVTLGHRNGLEAEVLAGLTEQQRVVLYPSELVADGAAVEARQQDLTR